MSTPQFVNIRCAPEHLLDSPTNPRVFFSETALAELAESIKSQGVIQPIVVRPIKGTLNHEIVVGARRTRAARLAGLEVIPAVVRELTDDEAATFQIHENLQRVDVSPLEEAEGFDRLIRKYKVPVQKVIKDSGKSKAYVYGRLALRKLYKPGQEALATGLPIDVAQIIASLPTDAIQRKALDDVRDKQWIDGKFVPTGWRSARDGTAILEKAKYFVPIKSITFELDDTTLRDDGRTCATCELRTINDPAAEGRADVCTDVECHDAKLVAHYAKQAQQLREQGHTVLQGDEAKAIQPHAYATPKGLNAVTQVHHVDGEPMTLEHMLAERPEHLPTPKLTYIEQHDGSLRAYLSEADSTALVKAFYEAAGQDIDDDDDQSDATPADPTEGWSPAEVAALRDHKALTAACKALFLRMVDLPRTTEELRQMALRELGFSGDFGLVGEALGAVDDGTEADDEDDNVPPSLREWINNATPNQLGTLLAASAIDDKLSEHIWQGQTGARDRVKERLALLESYGINILDHVEHVDLPTAEQLPEAQDTAGPAQAQLEGVPDPEEDAKEDACEAPSHATKPQKNVVRYRNPATGETWSGRGLQPKWLKAAIAAGNELSDYVAEGATA